MTDFPLPQRSYSASVRARAACPQTQRYGSQERREDIGASSQTRTAATREIDARDAVIAELRARVNHLEAASEAERALIAASAAGVNEALRQERKARLAVEEERQLAQNARALARSLQAELSAAMLRIEELIEDVRVASHRIATLQAAGVARDAELQMLRASRGRR